MTIDASYCVLLDANVWVAERLLQSSIGSALLHALARANASIALPEVVELELNEVLLGLAEKAIEGIDTHTSLLRHLSGQWLLYTAPSKLAIQEGINRRWEQLGGLLRRVPFTHEQAKSGLSRVIKKLPPSGQNNEQFRDCCIWEAARTLAVGCRVYLITNDSAFYDGCDRTRGLAASLRYELETDGHDVCIYPKLREFLSAIDGTVAPLDEGLIGSAIVQAVTPRAREIAADAADRHRFELGEAFRPRIRGYATPKPSLLAVSFELSFALKRVETLDDQEQRSDATLRVGGECSYDPNLSEVSEIEIREWNKSSNPRDGNGWGTGWSDPQSLAKEFSPSHIRLIK